MDEPRPEPEEPENLYLRWLEWVTENLGHDSRRGSIAAQAATHAALQGAGFGSAVDAARQAWFSDTSFRRPDSIDWLRGIGLVVAVVGSIMASIAVVGVVVMLVALSQCSGGGPIIVCPDMCGGAAPSSAPSGLGGTP